MKALNPTALWMLALMALVGCGPAIEPLTACPEGAQLTGAAPPGGYQQRCMKGGGQRHGPSRSWYENGRVRAETEWWEGVKHGRFTLWYENGQKRAQGQDWRGEAVGTWIYWDESGKVLQERTFETPPEAQAKLEAAASEAD